MIKRPKLFATLILVASLSIHLYADLALNSIVAAGTGIATWLGTPSSANLIAALTDETGTGAAVFANTPALVTPAIGAATGTSLVLTGGGVTVGTATYTQSKIYNTSVEGLNIGGTPGSSFDVNIMNKNGSNTISIPTGTTSVVIVGGLTVTGVVSGGAGDTAACLTTAANQLTDAGASSCIVSSLRYKSNWHSLPDDALVKVLRLTPGAFYYTNDPSKVERIGLNAENMQTIEPRLVFYETDGPDRGKPRGVGYEETVALLVKAIQELTARLEAVEQQR